MGQLMRKRKMIHIKRLAGDLVSIPLSSFRTVGELRRLTSSFLAPHEELYSSHESGVLPPNKVLSLQEDDVLFAFQPPRSHTAVSHLTHTAHDLNKIPHDHRVWGDVLVQCEIGWETVSIRRLAILGHEGWEPLQHDATWIPDHFQVLVMHPTLDMLIPIGYWSGPMRGVYDNFQPCDEVREQCLSHLDPDRLETWFEMLGDRYVVSFTFQPFRLSVDAETASIVFPHLLAYLTTSKVYRVRGGDTPRTMTVDVDTIG